MNIRRVFSVNAVACTFSCIFALTSLGMASPTQAAIPASERQVLLDLYTSANGQTWTHSNGWNGAAGSECGWYGVECDYNETKIIRVSLINNGVSGTLPPLTNLTKVEKFDVSRNQIGGSIPSLAGLTELRYFSVTGNQLTGPLPSLAGPTNLNYFFANNNQLSGPLPVLAGQTHLFVFNVRTNQLNGSIPSLAGLTKLEFFYVWDNRLTGSIPSLEGLTHLRVFGVDSNQLSGNIPDVPNPNVLEAGNSSLCPNALIPTPSAAWDAATGVTPWYQDCGALPDPIFDNGFEP